MEMHVETEALRSGERKLGLGSSAAAAAGAAGIIHAYHGSDLREESVRRSVLRDALCGHHAVAPQGSGADVAAAVLGGYVRFERHGHDTDARDLEWPQALRTILVWTGSPARTSDLVAKVKSLRERDPAAHSLAMAGLREAAATLTGAIERGDTRAAIDACDAHAHAMEALGMAADAPIVTPALRRASRLAAEHGGAAKPSGAGGGDVALAFFERDEDAARFGDACPEAGLTLLPIALGEVGVRVEH